MQSSFLFWLQRPVPSISTTGLAATACTQYQYNWEDFLPGGKTITSEEEFRLFLLDNGSKTARVNVTIDPTSSSYPIEIKGTKKISGRIEIAESRGTVYFSSTATPPGSASARANSLKNLFIVGTGAILESDSLTINVNDSAEELFNSVIEVSGGTIRGERLNIQISENSTVIGLYIGKGTEAENIAIENSNPGKIDIDENNNNSEEILSNITEKNPSIPQDDITTRFDAANAEDFFYNLVNYRKVILTDDFSITYDDLAEYEDWHNVLQVESNNTTLSFEVWEIIESLDIDLNGHTLTSYVGWHLPEGKKTLSISNGNLNMQLLSEDADWNRTTASIELKEDTTLIINDVNYKSDIVGIFLTNNNNGMTVNIYDSYFDFGGFYGIGTNATGPESEGLTIGIYGSTITTENCGDPTDPCSTTILFNVKGNVTIEDSTIIGNRQAMIARGGNYDLKNSAFRATGNDHDKNDYISNWYTGNAVPLAAIVFGNKNAGSSYAYSTTATLDNVTIEAPLTNRAETPVSYHGIYIWQNNVNEPVTVEGSIRRGNDCEVENLYNTETNDADVDITILN